MPRWPGYVISEETKKKIGAANKGRVLPSPTPETIAKRVASRGVVFEYEKRRFDLGTCTYLPDFYLPRTGVYWEVKGWLGPDSQKKIALFREQFPEIPLVVATKPILIAWEKSCNVSTHYL